MPFNQRTVEPRRVSRLAARGGPAPGEDGGFVVVDGRRYRRPVLFSSLDEVSCHTMINLIHQLSDLSRHAGDMFLDIEMEVCVVLQRSRKIHGRLEALHDEVSKFEPKKVKIRKYLRLTSGSPPHLLREWDSFGISGAPLKNSHMLLRYKSLFPPLGFWLNSRPFPSP